MPRKSTPIAGEAVVDVALEIPAPVADIDGPESEPLMTAVQMKAYELFLARGERHGHDLADWLEAERIVRSQIS